MQPSSAALKPLATAISLDTLPREVILEGIVPPLGAQFQIFNIVSLGQSSRSLNGHCQELLNTLHGKDCSTLLNESTLRDYAAINFQLHTLDHRSNSQAAMLEILRQAWNQPGAGGLLVAMSTPPISICETWLGQARDTAEMFESSWSDDGGKIHILAYQLSKGLTEAESRENFLPLLQAAAAAQRAGGGEIGLARAVGTHLKTLTGEQQFDLLIQFFNLEQVARMAPLPIDRTTALLWLENQTRNPKLGLSIDAPRRKREVTPVLMLVQFVCRQLTPADRVAFYSSYLESRSNHLSREEFDDLVTFLDNNPLFGVTEWAQPAADWYSEVVQPIGPTFAAALMAQMAADMAEFRANHSYLTVTEDVIARLQVGASGNSSNSSNAPNQGNPPAPANPPAQNQPAANAQGNRRRKKGKRNPCPQM